MGYPRYKKGELFRKCIFCGKEYKSFPSNYRKYCSHYCSEKDRKPKGKFPEEAKQKLRETLLLQFKNGRKTWNKGKKFPMLCGENNPSWKERIALECKNCKKIFKIVPSLVNRKNRKRKFCSNACKLDFQIKTNHLPKIRLLKNSPTKPEKKLIEIIKKNNLPYKFVGNGKFWIENMNPDFVNTADKKEVIEVFGAYWHDENKHKNIPYKSTFNGRKELLKKYGWDCIIFWDYEINEKFVLAKLLEDYYGNKKNTIE